MSVTNIIVELGFNLALFINTLVFIPQAIKIAKEKSAKSLSLLTFAGFFLIQLLIVLRSIMYLDSFVTASFLLSMISCGLVIVLILMYKNAAPTLTDSAESSPKQDKIERISKLSSKQPATSKYNPDITETATSKLFSKILLVEDESVAAEVVKNILLELDCEVDTAKTGKVALELIEKNYYDLIFMDIGLPDLDGHAVAKQIRSHRLESIAQIPIIALTAYTDNNEKQRCLDVAMNTVITKPLTKKWAKTVLDTFIHQRKTVIKLAQQADQTEANTEQAEKIIDFEYAKVLLGGNEMAVQETLMTLINSFPEEIAAIKEAYQQKNWEKLKNLAHKLKGSSSYCGTLRLKSICTELEQYIKAGFTTRIPELYQKLLAEIAAIQTFIKDQSPA